MTVEHAAQALIVSAPFGIVMVDDAGRIVFANGHAAAMFGYGRDALLGTSVDQVLPGCLNSAHPTAGTAIQLVGSRRDGTDFPAETILIPIGQDGGTTVAAIVRDVTERHHARSEHADLRAMVERAREDAERAAALNGRLQAITDVGLAHLPLDDLLRQLLGKVRELLDADAASVLLVDEATRTLRVRATVGLHEAGPRLDAIPIGTGFAGGIAAERRAVIVDDIERVEVVNPALRASGVRSMIGVPIVLGDRVLGVLHVDTRCRHTFTEDDARVLQLVADRVALAIDRTRLYEAEQQARAAAEASLRARAETERLKDDLVNMVVHDLKNPVNGIAMLVQLLRRKGPFTAMQQRSLTQIERTCRDLLRLIANVLEIGKIEAGRMPVTLEPIVLAELVDEIAAEYDPVASEVGRRLVIAVGTGGAPAHADRTLLKRVLVNLVVNALRHSGSPEVRIDALSGGRGTDVTLRVTDTGHGIPEDEQAHVFEKFETLRGHTTGDTGLGLHFCKLAVERMGGRITLTSGTGAGTTFAITLPTRGDP